MTTAVLRFSKIQKINFPQINWKAVCFVGFFAGLILLVFYVWQVNDLTKGYYLINSYGKQLASLSQENKSLQVSFAESSFWGQAMEKIQALNFQKTIPVKYIQILDNTVGYQK